jgi:hypothetical protein
VLHGNFDRPEWECEQWKQVAGFHGFILCPRGVRTPWADRSEDRWTYRGPGAVQKEVDAAFKALEKKHPGKVSKEQTVLAGFSLGAIYSPGLAIANPGRYPYVFLVEGAVDKLEMPRIRALRRAGVKGIGMAMSSPKYRRLAKGLVPKMIKARLLSVFVDMRGAGHGYSDDFAIRGRLALKELVGE